MLGPAYLPVIRRAEKVVNVVKRWTNDSIDRLQGWFGTTDWNTLIAPSIDINEQVDIVTSYIYLSVWRTSFLLSRLPSFPTTSPG